MMRSLYRRAALFFAGVLSLSAAPAAAMPTVEQFREWLNWYLAGDLRADFNHDGQLTPSDFAAFLQFYTDPPVAPEWTEMSPSRDSIVVYVSSSLGNDNWNGLTESRPVRTISRAYQILRDDKPDWMLLRRGDIFVESFPSWKKSGRSAAEPMVVSTYGPSTLRPDIRTGVDSGISSADNEYRSHLRFVGLRMSPHQRGTEDHPTGIRFVGPHEDILVENCYIFGYADNLAFIGGETSRARNVRVRRSIIANSWAVGRHSQGLYASKVDGLLVEESVFDHNGWHPSLADQTRTIFNHGVYVQRDTTGLTFRENVVARSSSHALQARNGGEVVGNVFYRNPISILWGNEGARTDEPPVSGRVNDNLILEGVDLNGSDRGWAIHVQNVEQGEVNRNIISKVINATGAAWGLGVRGAETAEVHNTVFDGNVVHNWPNGISIPSQNAADVTFIRNVVTSSSGIEPLVDQRDPDITNNVTFIDNKFFRGGTSQWFHVASDDITFSAFRSVYDRQADALPNPNLHFPDASWTLNGYAASKGYIDWETLLAMLRNQRRYDWRQELTTRSILNSARAAYGVGAY